MLPVRAAALRAGYERLGNVIVYNSIEDFQNAVSCGRRLHCLSDCGEGQAQQTEVHRCHQGFLYTRDAVLPSGRLLGALADVGAQLPIADHDTMMAYLDRKTVMQWKTYVQKLCMLDSVVRRNSSPYAIGG